MFQYIKTALDTKTLHFQLQEDGQLLTVQQVLDLWQNSIAFCAFYNQLLVELPFEGFFWENKPMSRATLAQPYEFVVIGTSAFEGKATNSAAFANYFDSNEWVVDFANLGKNATLIVPCPNNTSESDYLHIGKFVRNAPAAQCHALWTSVGTLLKAHVRKKETAVWLSTSGLGVYWLHLRLDQRPKYYIYKAYKTME